MKRALFTLGLVFCAGALFSGRALAQTPSCSNITDQTEPFSASFPAAGYTLLYLPHATGANNSIGVLASASTGDTLTVTDDKGNTYANPEHENDGTNSQTLDFFYTQNITPSSNPWIKISHSASDAWVGAIAFECTNAGAIDVVNGNHALSNTVTGGSLAVTQVNDFLILGFWNDYQSPPSITGVTPGSQANITWQLANKELAQGFNAEFGVYSSTSAINPTMTTTGSGAGFVAATVAIKAAAVGTPFPSGMLPVCIKTLWIAGSARFTTLPRTEGFVCPTTHNAQVAQWVGGPGATLTSVSDDSGSNVYGDTGAAVCNNSCVHTYYTCGTSTTTCGGAAASTTLTVNGVVSADSAKLYAIQNGSTTSFFDKTVTNTGSQATAGNLDGMASLTPTNASGLVLADIGVANNTMVGVTGAGQLINSCLFSQESVGNGGCDENNGFGFQQHSSTASIDFVWTEWNGSTNAGLWAAREDAFNAAPTGGGCTAHLFAVMGVGAGC